MAIIFINTDFGSDRGGVGGALLPAAELGSCVSLLLCKAGPRVVAKDCTTVAVAPVLFPPVVVSKALLLVELTAEDVEVDADSDPDTDEGAIRLFEGKVFELRNPHSPLD